MDRGSRFLKGFYKYNNKSFQRVETRASIVVASSSMNGTSSLPHIVSIVLIFLPPGVLLASVSVNGTWIPKRIVTHLASVKIVPILHKTSQLRNSFHTNSTNQLASNSITISPFSDSHVPPKSATLSNRFVYHQLPNYVLTRRSKAKSMSLPAGVRLRPDPRVT